LTINPEP